MNNGDRPIIPFMEPFEHKMGNVEFADLIGFTKREVVAMVAMHAIISQHGAASALTDDDVTRRRLRDQSYKLADTMLGDLK